jgi:hypothetical protein
MTESDSASEHLRVIRRLMERATVYRALSAPSALLGGAAAIVLAWWLRDHGTSRLFLRSWLLLFAVLAALNLFLLWRDSRHRGQPFFSSGMHLALRALTPPLLCGGVLGVVEVLVHGDLAACAILWCLFYGLALLATATFSPPSVQRLGRAFVAAGLVAFVGNQLNVRLADDSLFTSPNIMAATFGAFHLLYGLAVLIGSRRTRT